MGDVNVFPGGHDFVWAIAFDAVMPQMCIGSSLVLTLLEAPLVVEVSAKESADILFLYKVFRANGANFFKSFSKMFSPVYGSAAQTVFSH